MDDQSRLTPGECPPQRPRITIPRSEESLVVDMDDQDVVAVDGLRYASDLNGIAPCIRVTAKPMR